MKRFVQHTMYLIIALLVLAIIRVIIVTTGWAGAQLMDLIIGSIIFYALAAFILYYLLMIFFRQQHRNKVRMGIILFFVAGELLFAWWLYYPRQMPAALLPAYRYYYEMVQRNIIQLQEKSSRYHPDLFYTLQPHASFSFHNAEFRTTYRTNSLGLRDSDTALQRPEVVCLGDSFGMGWGVEQEETYSWLLQQSSPFKVLNAGVSSYGTAREILNLQRIDTSHLKYLVIQYCRNDFEENLRFVQNGGKLDVSDEALYQKTVRSHELLTTYYPGKHFSYLTKLLIKQVINSIHPVFPLEQPQPVADVQTEARTFLRVLLLAPMQLQDKKIIVFHLDSPALLTNDFTNALQSVMNEPEFAGKLPIEIVPVAAHLSRTDFFLVDTHINANGHQKVAALLSKTLQ